MQDFDHTGQFGALDFAGILDERWVFMLFLGIIFASYVASMDFKRFLAIVAMAVVFQLMWETASLGLGFPYFTLHYYQHPEIDFYIVTVPFSAIVMKSIGYGVGSYLLASAAGRKYIHGKVDMAISRGKRVGEHVTVGLFASMMLTLSMAIVEPVLASGSPIFLGDYEYFTDPGYFGVDPMYFLGVFLSSMTSFSVIALLESRIGDSPIKEKPLFDYDREVQSMQRRHKFGFIAFSVAMFVPAFVALLMNVTLGLIDFLLLVPAVFATFGLVTWWATKMDSLQVSKFCKKNPGSFVCRL